jgi:hypothetical protein
MKYDDSPVGGSVWLTLRAHGANCIWECVDERINAKWPRYRA